MFLLIEEDGTISESRYWEPWQDEAIIDGVLEVIRFHDNEFQRWEPGVADWFAVGVLDKQL